MIPRESSRRFGIQTGCRLLVPESMRSEFVADVPVFPVPRAARRLAGMIHLTGHAVPVLDLSEPVPDKVRVIERKSVLVLGEASRAVGIISDQAPVALSALVPEIAVQAAPQWMASALVTAYRADGQIWWEVDLAELVSTSLQSEPAVTV